MGRKGQAINIDWTIGLALFLLTALTTVLLILEASAGGDEVSSLRSKAYDIQSSLEEEASIGGRKISLISRGPENISDVPIDKHYSFNPEAYPGSEGGEMPVDIDFSNNRIIAITDVGNISNQIVYFNDEVTEVNYVNDISTGNWLNNSKISVKPGGLGLESLRINGKELLSSDADLGAGTYSVSERELHAETLSGNLRVYNGSTELILDNRSDNVTFNLDNFTTLYWHADESITPLTGTGHIKGGQTKGFTIASDYGITFLGDLTATVSKPSSSTVRAEIDAEKVRIRLHDSNYEAGKKRIKFYDEGYVVLGPSKEFAAAYNPKISQLNNISAPELENILNLENFRYNIEFGSWLTAYTNSQKDWNLGDFDSTSSDRSDNSGELGIGYLNGTTDDSLVGYWRFDEEISGDGGTVTDYSGNGNDGITHNGVETDAKGVFGTNGFEFDEDGDKVVIPDDPSLDIEDELTILAWIKPLSAPPFPNHAHPIRKYDSTTDNNFQLYHCNEACGPNNTFQWFAYHGGDWGSISSNSPPLKANEWVQVGLVYDSADGGQLYFNGKPHGKRHGGGQLGTTDAPLEIKNDREDAGYVIDEVRIYDRALNRKEVEQVYNQKAAVGKWSLDKTNGTVVPGESSAGDAEIENFLPMPWEQYENGIKPNGWYIKSEGGCDGNCSFDFYIDQEFSADGSNSFRYLLNPNNKGGNWQGHPIVRNNLDQPLDITSDLKVHWKQYDRAHSFDLCLIIEDSNSDFKDLCYQANAQNHWGDLGSNDEDVNMSEASGEIIGTCYHSNCYDEWHTYERNIEDDYLDMYNDSTTPVEIEAIEFRHFLNGGWDEPSGTNIDNFWINEEPVETDGKVGGGLSFDGINDRVRIHTPVLSSQTISFWFKPPSGSGNSWEFPYMKKNDGTLKNPYIYGARPGEPITYEIRDESGNYRSIKSNKQNWNLDQWYHFTGIYNNKTGEWQIYINGELDAQKTASFNPANPDTALLIGSSSFNGSMDEIRIHDYAFSSEEVENLYIDQLDRPMFNAVYTRTVQTGSLQAWKNLVADATIPPKTNVDMIFESLDSDGDVVDRQIIPLKESQNKYILATDNSEGYRISFRGSSDDPTKTWEIEDYRLTYGPALKRGEPIPQDTSTVVSEKSSAIIQRNGSFSSIQSRVVLWG